jgi:hypothetical protein
MFSIIKIEGPKRTYPRSYQWTPERISEKKIRYLVKKKNKQVHYKNKIKTITRFLDIVHQVSCP